MRLFTPPLTIRTIGILRATVGIGIANLTYNIARLVQLTAPARRCANTA